MLENILKFSRRYRLFDKGDSILLACSGGPDSLCMAHIFWRIAEKYSLKIAVAHVEHGIRKSASIADAAFVEKFCREKDIPFYIKHVDARGCAEKNKISLEAAARHLRYAFLRKLSIKLSCSAVAVAHQRGDQAETVLMHLLRGAGLDGLSGMQPKADGIIRPLLDCSRDQIEAYCAHYKLQPRLDATNNDTTYRRNSIRHELLPYLMKYNPNIEETLNHNARLLSEDNDFLKTYTRNIYEKISEKSKDRCALSLPEFLAQHKAIEKRICRSAVLSLCGSISDIENKHINDIINLCISGKTGRQIDLPHKLKASIEYNKLILTVDKTAPDVDNTPVQLNLHGETFFLAGLVIKAEKVLKNTGCTRQTCFIDADSIRGKLRIRRRINGDVFSPKGINGHKKLKDIFIDRKIPRGQRGLIPIIFDDKGIVWAAGVQQDNRCVPTEKSKNLLKLTLFDENKVLTFLAPSI